MESPSPASCWSNVVKSQPAPKPQVQTPASTVQVFADSCKSSKGVAVAVIDANAIIQGGEKLSTCADKFVSVPEVLDEIRDPVSRHRLAFVPFTLESMDPSPEALNKVIKFAKATGDLQTLSDVDIKLIALTYTLETQIHGTKHLRECPPPVHTVNAKRLPEKDLPGWGSNVPYLEEWEALEQDTDAPSNSTSKILPLQDLNLNIIPSDGQSEDLPLDNKDDNNFEYQDETKSNSRRTRRYPPKKKEFNIEGKMVADGIDASQGQHDDNEGDWTPAVSRSTQRRYLRRKSRCEYYESLAEKDGQLDVKTTNGDIQVETNQSGQTHDQISALNNGNRNDSQITEGTYNVNLPKILKHMKLEEDSLNALHVQALDTSTKEESDRGEGEDVVALEGMKDEMEHLEYSSQTNESVDTSNVDDVSSDQSWMLRSLSESSVACVTGDFAMQNVLLQMGLRLLAPGGMQIRQLHRWILKCHACYNVTAEIGKIFCPKCGNGGTLRKVAVTVGENGVVLSDRKSRIILRGTKFSLPLPQGGRDAITKNLVLREDQLPQKFLHPKTKKKVNKQGDEFFAVDDFFGHHNTDKRAPLQPPVRQALAVFSGKRNPNDNHYSRSKFDKYVDYALDVPMYYIYRKKKYIDCSGMSFRGFMAGKLPPVPGEFPTLTDWENHLTTIFPEVRLKRYLEMRGSDGGPWRRLCALNAFWVGLLYDEVTLQNIIDITADWTPEERQMLRNKVPKTGLNTPFRDGLLKHVAQDIVKLAKDGSERRGYKESGFLNEVTEVAITGVTPAEKLLELYNGKWEQNIDPVFEELLY